MCSDHNVTVVIAEVHVVVHGVQLLLSEMIHLVHQLGYYMTFEVLEVSWHALMTALEAPHSLDQLIAAHNTFLARIVKGALLDHKSAVSLATFNHRERLFYPSVHVSKAILLSHETCLSFRCETYGLVFQ